MRGLYEGCKLVSRNQCYIASAASMDDHNLATLGHVVAERGQVSDRLGVGCFSRPHRRAGFLCGPTFPSEESHSDLLIREISAQRKEFLGLPVGRDGACLE